jgi:hypothetical protein
VITWDEEVLRPVRQAWSLSGRVLTGGQSLSGLVQTAKTDGGGFWTASLECPVQTRAQARLALAYDAALDGGATALIVPQCLPRVNDIGRTGIVGNPTPEHSDANVVRSVKLSLSGISGGYVEPGVHFSIDHADVGVRLYRVSESLQAFETNQVVEVRPPLRGEVTVGQAVDFANPRCLMRLANPESLRVDLSLGRFATIAPQFLEHFE